MTYNLNLILRLYQSEMTKKQLLCLLMFPLGWSSVGTQLTWKYPKHE